jgi:Double zinc ribbon
METYLVVGAIVWIVCGMIGGAIMSGRGHSFVTGCAFGVLFGPLGVLIAAVLAVQPPPDSADDEETVEDQDRRPCPYCAEMILRAAKVCHFCGREVEPLPKPNAVAPLSISGGSFVRCPVCKTKNYATADHCEKCGIHFLAPSL